MPPVWKPKHPENSRIAKFMRFAEKTHNKHFTNYQQLQQWSIENPASFWQTLSDYFAIAYTTPATQILNEHQHMQDARWFTGATLNFAQQLLRRKDNHPAIVSIDEQGNRSVLTYQELSHQVAYCAKGLQNAGIVAGDRVAAIMPNVPQTVIAMLAASSLGAVWSSCSPDFGAQAVVDRLGQIAPKVLFVCDGHQYMGKTYDASSKIMTVASTISSLVKIVICPIIGSKFLSTLCLMRYSGMTLYNQHQPAIFVPLPFAHPLYILFSSGTTGKPKSIIHGAGGTVLQHVKELGLHTDIGEADNLCFYTTCGWMMWNWMVSVLALGATLTLYEEQPPGPMPTDFFRCLMKKA